MRSPHLLRVEEDPVHFASLIVAARGLGLRLGWLDLERSAAPVSEPLESAAKLGALRAVAVGEDRTVAVKPLRGPAILRDLLREHFQGCALVLVRGDIAAPSLRSDGDAWIVTPPAAASRRFTSEGLSAALRKPRPWDTSA